MSRSFSSLLCASLSIAVAASLTAVDAAGASPTESPSEPKSSRHFELKNTTWPFLAAETGGAAAVYIGVLLASGDPPSVCRWCSTNGFDDAVRNALRASNPRPVGIASHVFSLGAVPVATAVGLVVPALQDDELVRAGTDAWIVANAVILTAGVNKGVKRLAARQRPAFHYGVQGETEYANQPDEANLSFFSADSSVAFSIAASGATLAYLHGYESAPWLLGGGALFATTAGVMRIIADMHWATDVITGALVGAGFGVSVPLLLHSRRRGEKTTAVIEVVPQPEGVTLFGIF